MNERDDLRFKRNIFLIFFLVTRKSYFFRNIFLKNFKFLHKKSVNYFFNNFSKKNKNDK